jgi:hypothetical protein
MKHRRSLVARLLTALAWTRELPPVEAPDLIRVERTHPKQLLAELKEPQQIAPIVTFINARLAGWSVPYYGPPVGQVYLFLYKSGECIGDFYVGPSFFGRDYGEFLSQRAAEEEIAHLGQLLGMPLVEIVHRV